jgi:hypothetical protein
MLDSDTTAAWARRLVAFINRRNTAEEFVASVNPLGLPFQRRSAKKLEALRARAESSVRWLLTQEIDDAIRGGELGEWLTDRDAVTDPEWNHVPIDGSLDFDARGRVVVNYPHVRSPEAFVGITIAEVFSSDSPVRIEECALEGCHRLFARVLDKVGRPQQFCVAKHAATSRLRQFRKDHRQAKSRRSANN